MDLKWIPPQNPLPLGVRFQQVVHSVRIGETGVSTLQGFRSAPNEHPQSRHEPAIGSRAMPRARLTPCRRAEMAVAVISGRLSKAQAGLAYGVCAKIVARWTGRFRVGGREAMCDRSSRPLRILRQTDEALALRVAELRRQRLTGAHITLETGVSPASVSRILKRAGPTWIRGRGSGGRGSGISNPQPQLSAMNMPNQPVLSTLISNA